VLMSPSPEEPVSETGAGRMAGADAGSAVSDEVRPVAGGADTGLVPSEPVAGGPDADSVISDGVRAVATGADRGCVSVLLSVSSARGEDLSRAFVDGVCRSRLRTRRHASELCRRLAAFV